MHWRRFASFLLGAWMFGLFAAAYYATVSSDFASRVLSSPSPQAAEALQSLGESRAQMVLSHMAAEQSRYFLARFSEAEIVIGLVLTASLLLATHANRLAAVLSGAMTVLAAFLRFVIGAQIAVLGRNLDFVPDAAYTRLGNRLWMLQLAYAALVIVKVLLGAALTWYLLTFKTRLRESRRTAARTGLGA